jgi:hypothetical protein
VFSIRRSGRHFLCTIGLPRLRELAAAVDQVSAAVLLRYDYTGLAAHPALTGALMTELRAFPDDAHLQGWEDVAASLDGVFPQHVIRGYLLDAALDFLVQHEFAHARLGHVDAVGELLPGAVGIAEGEQARQFSFLESARGLEYAADVSGSIASAGEMDVADRFANNPITCGRMARCG